MEALVFKINVEINEARCDLAAIFRWTARESMHEGIANHFSFAVSDDGQQFLMNPYGVHFSKMRASDLLFLDARKTPANYGESVDPTAWWIHGAMHRNNPKARCIVHLHSHYATALSTLKNPTLPPIDQTSCRFFNRVAVDLGFDGMGLDNEAERLSALLGDNRIVLMGNHGFMTAAESPALAFDLAYFYERACRTYITALSTGLDLSILSDTIAEKTAKQWEIQDQTVSEHLAAIRRILDEEEPEYQE